MRRAALCLIASVLLVPGVARAADDLRPLRSVTGPDPRITDDLGRQVLLRGVNVNQLAEYFQASPTDRTTVPLTEHDADEIAAMGFGVVRLLVSWSRLEPSPGTFDTAYVERVRQATRWLAARDVRVVLDMHQDAYGPYVSTPADETCLPGFSPANGWDGAPKWATLIDGLPTCQVGAREIAPAVAQAWQSFWADREGVQSALAATWGRLAAALAREPGVVGYDLLNEPNPGYTVGSTNLAFLTAYYDRAIAAVRAGERAAGAPTRIAFFEPTVEWSLLGTTVQPPAPADRDVVFAPHLYGGSIAVASIADGYRYADDAAARYGTTIWSGEWGWFGDPAADGLKVAEYARFEDARAWGGAWWSWKQACGDPHVTHRPGGRPDAVSPSLHRLGCPGDVDLAIPEPFRRVLSRAAPRAVPGRITALTSDPASGAWDLRGRDDDASGSCQVDVWVPGAGLPVVAAEGVTDVSVRPVPGGWRVGGCARGSYELTSDGRRGAALTGRAACASRRRFTVRVPRVGGGARIVAVDVRVGSRVTRYRGRRSRVPVDLRGLGRGARRVLVVQRAADGRRFVTARAFRTCTRRGS